MSEIRNHQHILERADFSGLRFGNIRPMDVDGLIEFEGRCCIFMETKHGDVDLPTGERLALERNCDKWGDDGIVLVVRKTAPANTLKTYNIATLPVVLIRHHKKWRAPLEPIDCLTAVEQFASQRLGREIKAGEAKLESPMAKAAVVAPPKVSPTAAPVNRRSTFDQLLENDEGPAW